MSIYIISDLHLSLSAEKPMDVFGGEWVGYVDRIKENWTNLIKEEDSVIIPGDISWAMYLEEAEKDFEFLNNLPGTKYILKGNHDYWWSTITKLKEFNEKKGFNKLNFLQNNSVSIENYVICGTRGWKIPGDDGTTGEDKKIYDRELIRLELSLKDAVKADKEILVMLHYPPFNLKGEASSIIKLLKDYGVKRCFYGHIHGGRKKNAIEGIVDGIQFKLVSADHLLFNPIKI